MGRRGWIGGLVVALALLLATSGVALADKRIALIVANSAYDGKWALDNPGIDAALVKPSLEAAGFDVRIVADADLPTFVDAVETFVADAAGADVALFYFSGHGFTAGNAVGPKTLLMSTSADFTAKRQSVLERDGVLLEEEIMEPLAKAAKVALFYIDACREDPTSKGTGGGERIVKIMPSIDVPNAQVFLGMSTQVGSVAYDGAKGEGTAFARAFRDHFAEPGARVDDAFRKIREQVRIESEGRQVPDYARDTLQSVPVLVASLSPDLPISSVSVQPAFDASLYAPTLTYCSEGAPAAFDPAIVTGGHDFDASSRTLYSRLVEFRPGSTEIMPGLAESWGISSDGLTYTFHLREGVKFQSTSYFTPTRDLTAEDVVFSLRRQMDAESVWNQYLPDAYYDYFQAMDMPSRIASLEAVDPLTVRLTLSGPDATILPDLAMDFASIVSQEYAVRLEAAGTLADFSSKPIGTGPYQFVSYVPDERIEFAANPSFYRGPQKTQQLVFKIVADSQQRIDELIAGDCDIASYPPPGQIDRLRASVDLEVVQIQSLNVGYMSYNTSIAPFDKAEVRHALNMAIDRDVLLEELFGGWSGATLAQSLLPPTMWSWNRDARTDEYDPDTARRILAENHVTEIELWAARGIARPYNPNFELAAKLIQADWEKVGVHATIKTLDWGPYRQEGRKADRPGAFQIGWTGDNGDPDNFFNVLFACNSIGTVNYSQWCNPEFDALIEQARKTTNRAERARLYGEAQLIFAQEAPVFLMAHSNSFVAKRRDVSGYTIDPLGYHRFDGVARLASAE